MGKLVLVTGGAGFIGSHLVEHLIQSGYRVRVLDSLIYGCREWVHPDADFVQGDICDLEACRVAACGVSGVFHMAAMSRSAPSLDNIDVCTQSNIAGTQNVLIAAREAGADKVVYSGSSTYYGNQPPPHREYETPPDFLNFYGLSKRVGEQYCQLFDEKFNIPTVVLRYFNVYGPRQPQTGAYALVLGIFLARWAAGEPLEIHGNGAQRRDFIHVRDVVRANVMAFESTRRHEIFNVGSGTNTSIKELADMISAEQVYGPRRGADAQITLADISRIREAIAWEPQVPFRTGVRELMELAKKELD